MAKKDYDWENGARLEDHTRKKHKILQEYFRKYLLVRCQSPHQSVFKLIVVDGFSGAGRYKCGSPGSPIIFVETLSSTLNEINSIRLGKGLNPIKIKCHLLLNDCKLNVIKQLEGYMAPVLIKAKEESPLLDITTFYHSSDFETTYYEIKKSLLNIKCSNIFFNLDQCGYSHVTDKIIKDICTSWKSAEVILTFMISTRL